MSDPYQVQPPAAPYAPQPPLPGQYAPYAGGVEINGKAVAALVCGLVFLASPLGIMGLAFGKTAQRQIDAGMGIGRPLAKAGRVLGWVSVGFTIFWALYVVLAMTLFFTAATAVSTTY
ncbi:DUF4190 domain-containing protein [Glycomyces paridis]|uniref:DUF4190 domain-containing protein n=1 Tax=Glycomyces paridis TaxID=2126555 RepID=A0A4S8PJ91_9ACTN|nr:DUF4190 domain-containing protein [Glycomyces paridis]THV28479.1 DUF4190 domain-containing protein [Glycomyces paridis]